MLPFGICLFWLILSLRRYHLGFSPECFFSLCFLMLVSALAAALLKGAKNCVSAKAFLIRECARKKSERQKTHIHTVME